MEVALFKLNYLKHSLLSTSSNKINSNAIKYHYESFSENYSNKLIVMGEIVFYSRFFLLMVQTFLYIQCSTANWLFSSFFFSLYKKGMILIG